MLFDIPGILAQVMESLRSPGNTPKVRDFLDVLRRDQEWITEWTEGESPGPGWEPFGCSPDDHVHNSSKDRVCWRKRVV